MEERGQLEPNERCALILDDEKNSLGEVALRLLRLGIDVFYTKDRDEAMLLGQQEAERIRALLFPVGVDVDEVCAVREQIDGHGQAPQVTAVAIGEAPDEVQLARLREAGVTSTLWEPYDESALRFVVTAALAGAKHAPAGAKQTDTRQEQRLPTTLPGRAFVGIRRKDVIVYTLSPLGAFLETPFPFRADTRITLEIQLPDEPLLTKAEVVYARSSRDSGPPDQPNGMGVSFTGLDPSGEERIRHFLREQFERLPG